MDDVDQLAGALLSRFAGILEDLSTTAAMASTVSDPLVIAAMRKNLLDASALLEAVAVVVSRGSSD